MQVMIAHMDSMSLLMIHVCFSLWEEKQEVGVVPSNQRGSSVKIAELSASSH